MPDQYEQVRSLPFQALASALGLDIDSYRQRKHGQEFYGPCPIHGPKQNQTSFSYASDGRFNCFSCNAKGRGAIDLVKAVKQLGFQDAVKWLQTACGVQATQTRPNGKKPPAEPILAQLDGELKPLERDSWSKFKVDCPWLTARIPDAGIREKYGVFCYENKARKSAYSGRVMLPIKGLDGQLYGYLGRKTDSPKAGDNNDSPKYLFPARLPKSRFLFGAAELAAGMFGPAPLKRVYLVESPFCVMKFAMYGLPAVALFGWHPSDEQIQLLRGLAKGVVFAPDRNKRAESSQALPALAEHLWCRFPPLPLGTDDPESLSREEILAL